jgi:hypothetical protein
MAQSLSTTTITNSPPADPELARTIAALRSSMRDDACLTEPLSVMTRGRLGMRLDLLRGCAKQAAAEQIETEVAKLMTSYPSLRGSSDTDAKAMVYQYAEALAGVPLWAIRDACKAIARGAVPDINPDFAPSSARLRQLVDGYVSAIHKEARDIKQLLQAPLVPPDNPEMAERVSRTVQDGLKKLSAQLQEYTDADRRPRVPVESQWKAPTLEQLREIYKARKLPVAVDGNDDRNVAGGDTVTVAPAHEEGYDHLQAGVR